jgi:hypothetical protein
MSERKRKGNLSFGVGLVAGLFIGYYLMSEEGRQLRRNLQAKITDLGEDLEDKVQKTLGNAVSEFSSAVKLGMDLVQAPEAEAPFEEPEPDESEHAVSPIDHARNHFLRGLEKARRRIAEEN